MSYNLFIDDERNPDEVFRLRRDDWYGLEWVIARSNNEAFLIVKERGRPDRMALDFCLNKNCDELVTSFIRVYRTLQDTIPEYRVHSRAYMAKEFIDEVVETLKFINR